MAEQQKDAASTEAARKLLTSNRRFNIALWALAVLFALTAVWVIGNVVIPFQYALALWSLHFVFRRPVLLRSN